MAFEIGKEVVAIRSHSYGEFKKGDTFIIEGLRKGACPCHELLVDIGKAVPIGMVSGCSKCNVILSGDISWFSVKSFRVIDDISISELTEHLETTEPFQTK